MNKEAIKLVKKVKSDLWDYTSPNVNVKNEKLSEDIQLLDQALAKLQEQPPKCKTCSDTKQIPTPQSIGFGIQNAIMQECPDCTEQPPAGDFTKKARRRITTDRQLISTVEDTDETIAYLVIADEALLRLAEACDRLDRSEASRKELLTACVMGLNAMRGIKDINQLHDGSVENERRLEANIEQIETAIKSSKEISGEKERKL